MVVYGGATGGGSLASDDLYLLDMTSGFKVNIWCRHIMVKQKKLFQSSFRTFQLPANIGV